MIILRKLKNYFETNKFASSSFDWLAGTSLYKKIIYWKIERYIKKIRKTREYNVIIETTNFCNARCMMCPYVKMQRKREFMTDDIFEKITKRLKEEKISPLVFILNGMGDPLTDKKIFDRVKVLKKEFPKSVLKFYSNLGLANNKSIDDIVLSGLDEINVSFNGYNKENYEKTMGINYEQTLDNLRKLIRAKRERKSEIKIRLSMTLVSHNDGAESKFIKKWEKIVDSVSVNKVHTYNESTDDTAGKNKINFNKITYPCKYIWNTIVLGANGDIFLCCLDYEGEYNFGNIAEKSISETFLGNSFEKIREQHLSNNIKKIKICKNCYTPYKNGIEWFIDNLY